MRLTEINNKSWIKVILIIKKKKGEINNNKEFKIVIIIIIIRENKVKLKNIKEKKRGFLFFKSFLIFKTFSRHENVRIFADSYIIEDSCFK